MTHSAGSMLHKSTLGILPERARTPPRNMQHRPLVMQRNSVEGESNELIFVGGGWAGGRQSSLKPCWGTTELRGRTPCAHSSWGKRIRVYVLCFSYPQCLARGCAYTGSTEAAASLARTTRAVQPWRTPDPAFNSKQLRPWPCSSVG